MTPDQGIELVSRWPKDRTVPKRLAAGIKESQGQARTQLGSLVEALYAASETAQDFALIERYFS